MIPDFIIGMVWSFFNAILGGIADVSTRPDWFDGMYDMFTWVGFWIPLDAVLECVGVYISALGIWAVVRIVRYFLPGG